MTGAAGAMAEQSTTAMRASGDLGRDASLSRISYPLGLIQSVPTIELERRRRDHIRDTLRQVGMRTRGDGTTGEELLVAYDRLAARRAAERTQG